MTQPVRFSKDWLRLKIRPALLLGMVLIFSAACNFPGLGNSTPVGPDLILTYAAQTVQAQLTLSALLQTPIETPAPTDLPTETTPPPPESSVTPEQCDRAAFVADVTFPDNSQLAPGTPFVKIWRLKNTGSCTWDAHYALVFDYGESFGAPPSALLPAVVAPGDEVDISLNLVTPERPDIYQGYWKLRNSAGQVFGLGPDADKDFWVRIQVGSP
jgi:hypothetical protein